MKKVLISAVEGNRQKLDGGAMFGNVPRPLWEKWISPDEMGRITLACRAMLIEIDGQKILCETGIGAFFEPKLAERFGVETPDRHRLLESLEKLGLSENDIDFVILSHLHFDHAGGLLPTYQEIQEGKDRLLFAKAKYVVGEEAWMRACHPHFRDRASFIPGMVEKLKSSNRLVLVKNESSHEVFPERIRFRITNGHTPGQMHTVVTGDQSTAFFAGDLIPGLPWVHVPVTMGYDRFPELLIDEKTKLYEEAIPQDWLIFYTHDPEYSCSRLTKNESGKVAAANPLNELTRLEL